MRTSARATAADEVARSGHDRLKDFPVREYVSAMARELAHMARGEGDEALAGVLDSAADMAARPAG
jgi:hypothetical protein